MSHKVLFFFIVFFSISAYAQIGGRSTYQFLNLVNNPRQAALGGKTVTNYDYDPIQGLFNPATINPEMDNQLSVNAGVTYINYGNFAGYDEQGNSTGDFSGGEVAVSVGHARNIPFTNFHYGGNIKFISSKLEQYSSFGVAVDLGLIYVYEEWDLQVTAVARNFGTQLTPYDIDIEPLPFELIFGASQILENVPLRWHFTMDNLHRWDIAFANPDRETTDLEGLVTQENVNFFDEALRHMIIGVELFPESGFNIRLGYNFRRGEELRIVERRAFAGISAGFGIKLNKLRLSYAYSKYNSAASTSFFGLNIDLQ
jgi:hypothetical protein